MQRYSDCMSVIEDEIKEGDASSELLVIRAQMNTLFGKVLRCC